MHSSATAQAEKVPQKWQAALHSAETSARHRQQLEIGLQPDSPVLRTIGSAYQAALLLKILGDT